MRVYGSCIEPDGMDLGDETYLVECSKCSGEAHQRFWQELEGGCINQYSSLSCKACGHYETDWSEP